MENIKEKYLSAGEMLLERTGVFLIQSGDEELQLINDLVS